MDEGEWGAGKTNPGAYRPAGPAYNTPAASGYDVSHIMARLPPQVDRQMVRHMPFTEIRTMLEMSAHMGKEEKSEARYKAATTPRLFDPSMEDDRLCKLHIARTLPDSLQDPDRYWGQMPLRVENHVVELALNHLGLENKVAPLAIMKAGDMTNPLRLKYFTRGNISVQEKAPRMNAFRAEKGEMALSVEENWGDPTRLIQIQDAMFAYVAIMRNLFGFDYGPPVLHEDLHHWRWLAFRKNQIADLKSLIDGVMQRFAHQAAQRKPPMTMAELDLFITSHLKGLGGRSAVPDDFPQDKGGWDKGGWDKDGGRFKAPAGAGRGLRSSPGAGRQDPELCGQYNRDRCHKLHHQCSYTDDRGTVCLKPHPKKDHR